ncbi:MAG: hypothetical protein QOG60_125 [Frankiaceae bacterium]|nr:hypothetical protein [Frankiaceae bacterium]
MDADSLLLVTRDPLLPGRVAEQLPRPRGPVSTATPAAMSMTVLDDVRAVRRAWSSAGHVLVDADLVDSLRRARLPLRPRVALVLPLGARPVNWEDAVALGIDRMLEPDELGAWLADPAVRGAPTAAPVPAPAPTPTPASQGRLIVVTGACGGSGASTLAAALAVQTSGARVLVDLDRAGGGVDLVLGLEEQPGPRWPEALAAAPDVLALVDALPRSAVGLAVLSHDGRSSDPAGPSAGPDPGPIPQVLGAARRRYDLVVADLPRDSRSDLLPAAARDDAVLLLVVPPDIRGCAAALHRSRTLDDWPDLRLVVGPRSGPTRDEVTVGVGLDLPVVGVLPYDPTVPAAAARGEPPGGARRSSYGRAVAALIHGLDNVGRS